MGRTSPDLVGLFAVLLLGGIIVTAGATEGAEPAGKDAASLKPLLSIPGGACGACFSSDGTRLVVADGYGNKDFRICDSETGKELIVFHGHDSWVQTVAFSPDVKRVASGSADKTARVWDAATGKLLHTIDGHKDWVHSIAFSPDGRWLATASDEIRTWDVETGKHLRSFPGGRSLAISPDGASVATADREVVKLWNPVDGKERMVLRATARINQLSFSADGKRLAAACGEPPQLGAPGEYVVWEVATGKTILAGKGPNGGDLGVAFSPDGRVLAVSSWSKSVRFVELATGGEVGHLKRPSSVAHVRFTPDGKRLLVTDTSSTVTIWDAKRVYDAQPVK